MEVIIKIFFIKDLKLLPIEIQHKVKLCIEDLSRANNIYETHLDLKILKSAGQNENYVRIRIGNYRIGAELISPGIILLIIGIRGNFYKNFP